MFAQDVMAGLYYSAVHHHVSDFIENQPRARPCAWHSEYKDK